LGFRAVRHFAPFGIRAVWDFAPSCFSRLLSDGVSAPI